MTIAASHPPNRREAIRKARSILQKNTNFLDTETTGITKGDVVIEVAVINSAGKEVFYSLIRPIIPIPQSAIVVHGISNEMVRTAPFWPEVWLNLQKILTSNPISTYNADFDQRLLQQTCAKHSKTWPQDIEFFDIMKIFSEFMGNRDSLQRGYRYFKLEDAGKILGIQLPNAHRALADALLARELLIRIAAD